MALGNHGWGLHIDRMHKDPYAPQILYKVLLEKFLAGGTTAAQLEGFFLSVTWQLANRAAKAEVPYKHAELLLNEKLERLLVELVVHSFARLEICDLYVR